MNESGPDIWSILQTPTKWFIPKHDADYGQNTFVFALNNISLPLLIILLIIIFILILYLVSLIWFTFNNGNDFGKKIIDDFSILGRLFWSPKSSIELFNDFITSKIPGGYQSILTSSQTCASLFDTDLLSRCNSLKPPTDTGPSTDTGPTEIPKWWAAAPYDPYNMAAVDVDNAGDESFANIYNTNTQVNTYINNLTSSIQSAINRLLLLFYLNKGAIKSTQKLRFVS